jgi:hypothetical protein
MPSCDTFTVGQRVRFKGQAAVIRELVAEQAVVIMVGDDYRWHADISDLETLDDDEYCPNCGSTGCGWR